MEIKIDNLKEINICPRCLGSGRILAMQSVVTRNGTTKRGRDKEVDCNYCNGTGIRS